MQKIVKCKPVDMAEGKFSLFEAILEGDALMHWLKFKQVEIMRTSKNPDGSDAPLFGMCNSTFTICLQELKKHYFLKNLAHLQKAYLCNRIEKPNKLSIKNTTARLCNVNGRNPTDMNLPDLMDYFKQIELLNIVKQKSKTIIVDDDTNKQKKSSSQRTKSAKSKASAKGKLPGNKKKKICVL
eukprot:13551735-Ditylum_brightwellii.AAC.1